jgi:hypothetical protein
LGHDERDNSYERRKDHPLHIVPFRLANFVGELKNFVAQFMSLVGASLAQTEPGKHDH